MPDQRSDQRGDDGIASEQASEDSNWYPPSFALVLLRLRDQFVLFSGEFVCFGNELARLGSVTLLGLIGQRVDQPSLSPDFQKANREISKDHTVSIQSVGDNSLAAYLVSVEVSPAGGASTEPGAEVGGPAERPAAIPLRLPYNIPTAPPGGK